MRGFMTNTSQISLRSALLIFGAIGTTSAAMQATAQVTGEYGAAGLKAGSNAGGVAGLKAGGTGQTKAGGAALIPILAPPRISQPRMPPTGNVEMADEFTLQEGKSTLMRLPYPASRLAVGDPAVVDVQMLNPSEIYLLGKAVGVTNLMIWYKTGNATMMDIAVNLDTSALASRLAMLLPGEKNIKITTAAETLILSGAVSDVVKADQAIAIANAYIQRSARTAQAIGAGAASGPDGATATQRKVVNLMSIAAPQQVMLEVKVAEISKTLVDQLGASIGVNRTRGSWTYTLLSSLLSGAPSLLDALNTKTGSFASLDAQKRDGLVKVLAEPTVMAISGQEASFLAGGKIFIPVNQTNNSGQQVITLEEKEFGVAVKFTPTVLEGGRINLKVAPEVSDLNRDGVGITANGVSTTAILPSFTTRRATTTVQLFDGQSFAIGGLIKNNVTQNIKALPVLGELPVLGPLFSSKDFQTDRTELVFIITPHLVKPLGENYPLPTDSFIEPTRSQFFLEGKMEGTPPRLPDGQATGFDLK